MPFLPVQYTWIQPVLIGAVIVFIVDIIGNTITFSVMGRPASPARVQGEPTARGDRFHCPRRRIATDH